MNIVALLLFLIFTGVGGYAVISRWDGSFIPAVCFVGYLIMFSTLMVRRV